MNRRVRDKNIELINAVGKRINALRIKKGLQIKDVATDLKIHPITLGKYEKGDSEMPISQIYLFARYFYVTSDYLLGLNDDPMGGVSQHIRERIEHTEKDLNSMSSLETLKVMQNLTKELINRQADLDVMEKECEQLKQKEIKG